MEELDAHCHFWRLGRGDYGWLAGEGGPLAPIRRDFAPADHPGAVSLIAVQAAPTVAETEYLLTLGAREPRIKGVVGWVDLGAEDAVTVLERLAANPRFRGVRPMLQDIADTDWLLTAPRPDALTALTRLGLTFDALVTARHLPVLSRFASANPDLAIVIDHAAKPQPGFRPDWDEGMARLAGQGLYCKLSGLLTELSPDELRDPLAALRPIVAQLLDWFGPDRLIWGSDWPVLNLVSSYGDWVGLRDELLADLSADERAGITGGNALRFYGVEP